MSDRNKPILRLIRPERVAGSDQVAPLMYGFEDTARLLSCSVSTIERLVKRGKLVQHGTGKLRRITYESIVAYLNESEAA
jgi:excisionase family DNA binding protein